MKGLLPAGTRTLGDLATGGVCSTWRLVPRTRLAVRAGMSLGHLAKQHEHRRTEAQWPQGDPACDWSLSL